MKFKPYTEYEYKTKSFLRVAEGYPKKIGTEVFPNFNEQVKWATISETGDILLYARQSVSIFKNETLLKYLNIDLETIEMNPDFYKHPIFGEVKRDAFKSAAAQYEWYDIELYFQYFKKSGERFGYISSCFRKQNEGTIVKKNYYFIGQQLARGNPRTSSCDRNRLLQIYYYELNNGKLLGYESGAGVSRSIVFGDFRYAKASIFNYSKDVDTPSSMLFGCPPDFCSNSFIDAMLFTIDSKTMIFTGKWLFEWTMGKTPKFESEIKDFLSPNGSIKVPINIDAAFYDSQQSQYFFFKEKYFIVYNIKRKKFSTFSSILDSFQELDAPHIDAAVCFRGAKNIVYLFSGQDVFKYKLSSNSVHKKVGHIKVNQFMRSIAINVYAATIVKQSDSEKLLGAVVKRNYIYYTDLGNIENANIQNTFEPIQRQAFACTKIPENIQNETFEDNLHSSPAFTTNRKPKVVTLTTSVYEGKSLWDSILILLVAITLVAACVLSTAYIRKLKEKTQIQAVKSKSTSKISGVINRKSISSKRKTSKKPSKSKSELLRLSKRKQTHSFLRSHIDSIVQPSTSSSVSSRSVISSSIREPQANQYNPSFVRSRIESGLRPSNSSPVASRSAISSVKDPNTSTLDSFVRSSTHSLIRPSFPKQNQRQIKDESFERMKHKQKKKGAKHSNLK
ncbi:hypothetical protein B4U79_17238 [Dinothrombium tinctorium]|uniref:Uncharacterized protein n=1 Tax=Dinothrombium tinctorium TaxID=1965070 RepID=A0A443RIZ3_9ACAR|nr:hypothetical protein B4U79_17238 [Dinothrombium tinctorium]